MSVDNAHDQFDSVLGLSAEIRTIANNVNFLDFNRIRL